MFRNQYDNDCTVFSPQGRLHQVEYAMEAVKQGSACVGIKSNTHAVLLAIQRRVGGELASYQKKIIKVDNHIGVAFSGLTSDSRVLSNFLRTECMRNRMLFNTPLLAHRAAQMLADKAQYNTQVYGDRPYGVGFIIASNDGSGTNIYDVSPAGVATNYFAHAIGARSQSARTYLEANFPYDDCTLSELVLHGLTALRNTLHSDKTIALDSLAIAVVGGAETPQFRQLSKSEIEPFLAELLARVRSAEAAAASATAVETANVDDGVQPMDIE